MEGKYSREDIVNDKVLADQWNKLMMKVKKLGRGVQNYDEAYWESRRYKIVLFGVRLKFTQNPELKDILIIFLNVLARNLSVSVFQVRNSQ